MSRVNGSSRTSVSSGLILLSGEDDPGIAAALFTALAPFSVLVVDLQQIVIRRRLFLTVLIELDPAHATAIESDLVECGQALGVDIAVAFSDSARVSPVESESTAKVSITAHSIKPHAIATATSMAHHIGANIDRIRQRRIAESWLIEFELSGVALPALQSGFSTVELGEGVDFSVLDTRFAQSRMLFVLDVDSTLINEEVIDLLAVRAGKASEVSAITEAAMRGELDFAQSLAARVRLLAGLPASILSEVQEAITLTKGAEELISTVRSRGHEVALVTGGFQEIVQPLADKLGVRHLRANSLEIKSGALTGATIGPVIDRAGKASALQEFAKIEAIALEQTVAVGDGANDIEMLTVAGVGIAFMAKPIVQSIADIRVTTRDLSRILDLLGIIR